LRSARLGNPASQFVVGELLEMFPDAFNELPEEDTSQLSDEEYSAIYWYELAAEKGITDARKATEYLLAQ
jgi:TPR repeat protein